MLLTDPVTALRGVGPERAKKLERLGIATISDLLEHFPREYEDRSRRTPVAQLLPGEETTVLARVERVDVLRLHGRTGVRARLSDDSGSVFALWFGGAYLKKTLEVGREYLFYGKLAAQGRVRQLVNPAIEKPEEALEGLLPVYPATAGLSQRTLRTMTAEALAACGGQLAETLPGEFRRRYRLCERNFAVQNIHFPTDAAARDTARRRLAFEELFLLQAALLRLKKELSGGAAGFPMGDAAVTETLLERLPYPLTNAQRRVLDEVCGDMRGNKVCNRLIQGDVGSGKTAVAMAAAYYVIQNGYQAALMAPTEVLADQHYQEFCRYFEPLGIQTARLCGTMTAGEKRKALEAIVRGDAQMVIGTHALIQKNVMYSRLGLVITDEQHRFGVRQRGILAQNGTNNEARPHVVVMTATPIPRTLALILYGDLDISVIDELPPGRQPIRTVAVDSSYRRRIYAFIRKEVAAGRQAYMICPMIEESEKLEAKAAVTYAAALADTPLGDVRVACLHGRLPAAEKQAVMTAFAKGEVDVLVATTVVEVGVNVPNATVMLIENAERFGLAQLHQLRGRVGRGTAKSTCILVCDSDSPEARKRMEAMGNTGDGFVLAELDLKLRGPGEFFGTRQHGLPELKAANLYRDLPLLREAQIAARELLDQDPALTEPENGPLRRVLEEKFSGRGLPL